jgi:Flp pilus assembly CpaE family ATPase
VARPAIVTALPPQEQGAVLRELREAGFDAIAIDRPSELENLLLARRDVVVAILDGENDLDASLEYYGLLHEGGREIPALMVMSPRTLDGLASAANAAAAGDEFFSRPYSPEALRWRVEAMCIRSMTIDDGSGPVIEGPAEIDHWQRRATVLAVFNPKGGVGKTTVATNLASALTVVHHQRVLLLDADTVTGHVTTSLGLEQVRTVADSWRDQLDGGPAETFAEIASPHPSGMSVVALTSSPLNTDVLEPRRVADALETSRRGYDFVIVDLHPSYSAVNRQIFERADRILVPVTPDVPALRAAVQLREVALEIGLADRLALVVNRANSGVSVADMERTVGMPAMALIRSGGLLLVKAANAGRTVIEMYPKERISEDFKALAQVLVGPSIRVAGGERVPGAASARAALRIFGRARDAARA